MLVTFSALVLSARQTLAPFIHGNTYRDANDIEVKIELASYIFYIDIGVLSSPLTFWPITRVGVLFAFLSCFSKTVRFVVAIGLRLGKGKLEQPSIRPTRHYEYSMTEVGLNILTILWLLSMFLVYKSLPFMVVQS